MKNHRGHTLALQAHPYTANPRMIKTEKSRSLSQQDMCKSEESDPPAKGVWPMSLSFLIFVEKLIFRPRCAFETLHGKGMVCRSNCCADKKDVALEVQLWDAAAHAGQGTKLAVGNADVRWSEWQQGNAVCRNVTLHSVGRDQVRSAIAVQVQIPNKYMAQIWHGKHGGL